MFFLLLLIYPSTIKANDDAVPYSVGAVVSENQINKDVSYFDIGMEPGEELELEVVVFNSTNENIVVNVNNTTATTNGNGLITYDGIDSKAHESMNHSFSEISSIESGTVKVPASSQETVTIKVVAPEESFDGIILGGLHFSMDPKESEETEGVTIQNRYAYAIGVKIQETGNNDKVVPELILENVNPGIINHRTGLQTEFANTTPIIINKIVFEGSVYKEGEDEPLFTRITEDFSIAPNSKFNFPIMYDNNRLQPGNYIFKATANNDSNSWNFEEEFEVNEETADKANEEAVELVEEEDNSLLMYLVIGLGVLVAALLIVVIYLLRKRKK